MIITFTSLWRHEQQVDLSCFQYAQLFTALSYWMCKIAMLSRQKKSTTLQQYESIKGRLTYLCRYELVISVWDFALKLQAVAENVQISN